MARVLNRLKNIRFLCILLDVAFDIFSFYQTVPRRGHNVEVTEQAK